MLLRQVFIVCGVLAAVACIRISEDRVDDLKKRLDDIQSEEDESETRSERLRQIISNIPYKNFRKEGGIDSSFLCGMCYAVFGEFLNMRRIQLQSDKYLKNLALELCVDFEIQSEEVCHGVIELNAPSIFYIVDNRPALSADTICKVVFDVGDCAGSYNDDVLDFVVDIDNGTTNEIQKISDAAEKQSLKDLAIIHITDIHVDFKYAKGAFADCDEMACCRETDDVNEIDPESYAGRWGDYRSCDSPWLAINNSFHQIKRQHSKIDAIYFTGDIVDHFMWNSSVDGMKNDIEKVYNLMRLVFGNVPLYPILGNHDAQNIFSPNDVKDTSLSVKWLYDHVAELWKELLPTYALDTVRKGGYYTTLIRPGLRLISLNNNVCLTFNWWIMFEVKSIQTQFQWLHDVLLAAERAGEKVHILAHIPNGDEDYHKPCSREFQRIVDRFYKTIAAEFHGHTEFFGFNIFYEKNNESLPINMAWNGGSLATFSGVNRNYVSYNVDPVNFEVKDIESWIYNLTAVNQDDMQDPIWFRQFSLRDAFKLKDLTPSTLNDFVRELPQNVTAAQQLWRMKIKDSDLKLKSGCQQQCVQDLLCDVVTADNNDTDKCQKIKKQVLA